MIDDGDAVRHAVGLRHIMRGEEDGDLLLGIKFLDLGSQLIPGLRIEAQRRFVQEPDPGRGSCA
jgi:hypothetical protein